MSGYTQGEWHIEVLSEGQTGPLACAFYSYTVATTAGLSTSSHEWNAVGLTIASIELIHSYFTMRLQG